MSIPPSGQRCHVSSSGSVEIEVQGHCLKASVKGGKAVRPGVQPCRGVIFELSKASRKRMIEKVARLKGYSSKYVCFVTLTFGERFPSAKDAYRYLRAFHKRLERIFPGCRPSCIWRKELQERGAPHFHLLYFDLPYLHKWVLQRVWMEVIQEFITPAEWGRYCGSLEKGSHQGIFTRIEGVNSWRKAVGYVTKYMTKRDSACGLDYEAYRAAGMANDEGEYLSSGRMWGCFNEDGLPWADVKRYRVEVGKAFYRLRRVAAHFFAGVVNPWGGGFTLFVDRAETWHRLLCNLGIPEFEGAG